MKQKKRTILSPIHIINVQCHKINIVLGVLLMLLFDRNNFRKLSCPVCVLYQFISSMCFECVDEFQVWTIVTIRVIVRHFKTVFFSFWMHSSLTRCIQNKPEKCGLLNGTYWASRMGCYWSIWLLLTAASVTFRYTTVCYDVERRKRQHVLSLPINYNFNYHVYQIHSDGCSSLNHL